jgi:hypothetical protein
MAEAVAASSQLLSNLFKAAKTAETFYAGFHHASEEIKVLRAQCRQVALRLECLQVTAKILRNVDPLSFRLPQLLEECVELLWKDLIALQRKCPNVSQLDKKKQFAWAWKNRELMRKMVKQLELAEGNLSTILQALQL